MRHALTGALVALTMGTLVHAAAQDRRAEDEAAIRDLIARYVAAREARDPGAIGRLFTEDIDQLVSSGEWRRGHAGVVSGTLRSSARNPGRRSIAVEHIRFISPDIAIADGRYEITSERDGTTRRMWTTFVTVRRDDGWRITAIRNMLPAPQRNR